MDYEKKYLKMIGYIDAYTPYSLILQFLGAMVLTDKTSFLQPLLTKTEATD